MPRLPIIASLAVLLTAPAAPARDLTHLPRKAEEPRPSGCESFGPGFTRVQGFDTCVRLSGDVRAEVGFGGGGSAAAFVPPGSR